MFSKFCILKKLIFHVRGNIFLDESCVDELIDDQENELIELDLDFRETRESIEEEYDQ
jgi:hypothetical protein